MRVTTDSASGYDTHASIQESPMCSTGAQRSSVPGRSFRRLGLSSSSSGVPSNEYFSAPRLYQQLVFRFEMSHKKRRLSNRMAP